MPRAGFAAGHPMIPIWPPTHNLQALLRPPHRQLSSMLGRLLGSKSFAKAPAVVAPEAAPKASASSSSSGA